MARIRTVKPEFWEDDAVGALSFGARLLFIASWNLADDEGLLRWTPAYIKAQVFMYDDDIDVSDAERFMAELEKSEMVFPYRGGKSQQRLAYIINFHKHQRINRPSPPKLLPPSLQNPQVRTMYGERDGWVCHICSGEVERRERHWYKSASIDHIEPRAKGGSDYPSNLGLAHVSCNSGKRDRILFESVTEPIMEDSLPDSVPEGNGMEGSGEERKGTDIAPIASSRNEVWDALSGIFGEPETKTARSLRGKVCKSLTEAKADAEDIYRRVQAWPHLFPDATLTDIALEKHWTALGRPPLKASEAEATKHQRDLELQVAQEQWERERKAIGQ